MPGTTESPSQTSEFEEILNEQMVQIDSDELTDQQIHSLYLICGSEVLLAALKLLDLRAATKLVIQGGQAIYEVQGNDAVYHVQRGLRDSCTCKSYINGVIIECRQLICAHLLAVRVGEKLGAIEVREIDLEALIGILHS